MLGTGTSCGGGWPKSSPLKDTDLAGIVGGIPLSQLQSLSCADPGVAAIHVGAVVGPGPKGDICSVGPDTLPYGRQP